MHCTSQQNDDYGTHHDDWYSNRSVTWAADTEWSVRHRRDDCSEPKFAFSSIQSAQNPVQLRSLRRPRTDTKIEYQVSSRDFATTCIHEPAVTLHKRVSDSNLPHRDARDRRQATRSRGAKNVCRHALVARRATDGGSDWNQLQRFDSLRPVQCHRFRH